MVNYRVTVEHIKCKTRKQEARGDEYYQMLQRFVSL